MRNKTILVTGCAGFIGSNAVDALLADGWRVLGIDNLASAGIDNLKFALRNPSFKFDKADVTDVKRISVYQGKRIDAILHLAAFKIPLYGSAIKTLEINTLGTRNILELTRRKKNCKLVFASTSDVYGKSRQMPFKEEQDLLLGPTTIKRWAYAASKIFDEHLVIAYSQEYRIPYVILRYFNTYGPRHPVDDRRVRCGPHTIFIESLLERKPVTIYGDGNQKRCFCYIEDSIMGTLLALRKEKAEGKIFNIGNDKTEISILGLAKMIKKVIGGNDALKINFVPHKDAFRSFEDVERRIPDISKARKILSFIPEVSNIEGIKKTLAWHKGLRGICL